MEPTTLGIMLIATGGLNGDLLGSDEEEIILISVNFLDVATNEVIKTTTHTVLPKTFEDLSEEIKTQYDLSESDIRRSNDLESVLEELHTFTQSIPPFTLVTDGQLPLRQCLHPEAVAKNIDLPEYYNSFFDLRKLGDEPPEQQTIHSMTTRVQSLISQGHVFQDPELIQVVLEPGICSRSDEIDPETIVRARGLPWQSSDQDIARFFKGLNIAKGGVALCLSPQGRRNGEALIRFESATHREMALKRHKHHIGTRYIEVYKAGGEDFLAVAGGNNNEAQEFLKKGAAVIIRMRGLPYDCTAKQVLDFFLQEPSPCKVLEEEDGVLFVRRPDGRATGDAFVLFKLEEDSSKALSKHRESIGSRYIELFRSTTAEVQQVLNRCLEQQLKPPQQQQQQQQPEIPLPLLSPLQTPILQQQMITTGTRKDCIRLRGLPYEAQVEHILEFLGEHSKNIIYQGVHMVYNAQGQPSGEAFIQMDSEQSAYVAAQTKHHRYMIYFKKQRYIEVFQCSGDDMNCVLTGSIPSPPIQPQKYFNNGSILQQHGHYGPYQYYPAGTQRNNNFNFQQIFYWPGSTPPISPNYYYINGQNGQGQQNGHAQIASGHSVLPPDLSQLTLNIPKTFDHNRDYNGNGAPSVEKKFGNKNYLELFMA